MLYGALLLVFPIRVLLNSDEAQYVRQAVAFAAGQTRVVTWDARDERWSLAVPSTYPPGTSGVQTPFVLAFGWRGAAWASYLSTALMVALVARCLRTLALPPVYAGLVFLYPPLLVLARTGMGDLPSAAIVTAAWTVALTSKDSVRRSLAVGVLGGASLLFRDSAPVFLAPLLVGLLVRKERWALAWVSFGATALVRPLLAQVLQGDALTFHGAYPFTAHGALGRLALYLGAIVVLLPGGALGLWVYRGPRWPEFRATAVVGIAFFSLYTYSGQYSGFWRRLVLGPRYLIPLVPLAVIAVAWAVERSKVVDSTRVGIRRVIPLASGLAILAVHPAMSRWASDQATLLEALQSATSTEAAVVTELGATAKYLNEIYGRRRVVDRVMLGPAEVPGLRQRMPVQLAFIDRTDSDYWRSTARLNDVYVAEVARHCAVSLVLDRTATDHLRVWNVVGCGEARGP